MTCAQARLGDAKPAFLDWVNLPQRRGYILGGDSPGRWLNVGAAAKECRPCRADETISFRPFAAQKIDPRELLGTPADLH